MIYDSAVEDRRTNEDLFLAALQEDYEDEAAWDAVAVLRRRGTEEVFQLAVQYCQSTVPLQRARGLDVLAQLGARKPLSERPHFEDSVAIALEHLRDENARVVSSAAWALSHLAGDTAISALIKMRANSDPDVRWAVAHGMQGSPREDAIATLIELMDDADAKVRDWATFELGSCCDVDTAVIREALRKRLSDSFKEARDEAIWGLAQRKDEQGLSMLIDRLSGEHWIAGDETAAADTLNLPNDTPAEQLLDGLRRLLSDHFPR